MRYALLAVLWCAVPVKAQYIPTPVDSWADVGTELHRISQRLSQQSLLSGGTTYGNLTSTGTIEADKFKMVTGGGANHFVKQSAAGGVFTSGVIGLTELPAGVVLSSGNPAFLASSQTFSGANTLASSTTHTGLTEFTGVGSTTTVRISTAIEITGANLQDPIRLNGQVAPAFYAYKNSTQDVATSSRTGVNYEVELFDTNNNFSLTTERFIPTVAGTYQFSCAVFYNGTLTDVAQWSASIFKNETELCPVFGRTSGTASQGLGTSCALTANGSTDYFTCRTYQDSGDPEVLAASGNNFFAGARVW